MKNVLSIVVGLLFTIMICDSRVTISKSEYDKLKGIDKSFSSDEVKNQIFGDKAASKYEYSPIVTERDNDDDSESVNNNEDVYYSPPYAKLKIDLDFVTNCPKLNLYDKSSGERELTSIENFADVNEHMRYLSKHRPIIHINKLHSMKSNNGGDKKKYGLSLKLTAVECTNKPQPARIERSNSFFLTSD